jgi:hypothetical protein
MGDRIALERLARQKLIDGHTTRANEFISRVALKSLEEIDPALAEPFSYLTAFASVAAWLSRWFEESEDFTMEYRMQSALTRGFVLGMIFQRMSR